MELFSSREWAAVIADTYGFELDWCEDLPYCVIDDPAGRRVIALPFSDYLPIDTEQQAGQLRQGLSEHYPHHRLVLKTRLPHTTALPGLEVTKRAVYHRYLPGGRASSSFRRGTRQAIRARTQVQRSTEEAALDRFQTLYHRQRLRKFGGIPQPPTFFGNLHREFVHAGKGFYLEAYTAGGQHAATLVVLRCGDGWFYKFGTSDPALLDERPNNLLFDHLTQAVDGGEAAFLDLGLSGSSEAYAGLRRFKSSIGAEEHPLTYLTQTPTGYDAATATAFLQVVGSVTDALVKVDAERATVEPLSETLYRYFA